MQKKYFITTYGCQLNVHESEKLAGFLCELGFSPASKIYDADVIVFNTCAIRASAEQRAIGNIGALKSFKKFNKEKIIAVCGCMTQQKEMAYKLNEKFPFIDIIFGTSNLHLFKEFLLKKQNQIEAKNKNHTLIEYSEDYDLQGENCPLYRTSGDNAWVNIMQGCNNFCSYCIVPYVRGRERSRPKTDIIKEIKQILKENRFKKITLLGQNVNSYGKDLSFVEKDLIKSNNQNLNNFSNLNDLKNTNFSELLNEICALNGDFKLSFLTSHPKDLSSDIIDAIVKNDKILKEIHLPLQSGSDRILKRMNRHYTISQYLSIIEEIRAKIPEVRLTTDIIVGFPGETEEDFNQTCEILKKVRYNGVFAFMYSKRLGTPAVKMTGQVELSIKKKRVNQILSLVKQFK